MAMATLPTSSISPPSTPLAYPTISVVPLSPTSLRLLKFPRLLSPIPTTSSLSSPYALPAKSTTPAAAAAETAEEEEMRTKGEEEESMSISNLKSFVVLNLGTWSGTFYQFDANGNFRHRIRTRLAAGSYGEDELISLIQTLYIKQPPSSTSVSGEDEEPEWAEYKIKESNMFTVDKYQQICFFPNERAFALRYQTAGMLETVLRQGVLGEDDTGEESPRNLKLPSRRPSIVCENCLYSLGKDTRARAFHIMDPKGILEMLLIFLEEKATGTQTVPSLEDSKDNESRITPFLGRWKGHSVTKRSGVYGATIAEHDTLATLEIDEQGQLLQVITSTSKEDNITTNVPWMGCILQNVVIFDEGFQFTLLPGGMYMGYPSDVAKSVAESRSFHLEFCWIDSSSRRQRLIRTFDAEGYAVSSTYYLETMI